MQIAALLQKVIPLHSLQLSQQRVLQQISPFMPEQLVLQMIFPPAVRGLTLIPGCQQEEQALQPEVDFQASMQKK